MHSNGETSNNITSSEEVAESAIDVYIACTFGRGNDIDELKERLYSGAKGGIVAIIGDFSGWLGSMERRMTRRTTYGFSNQTFT